MLNLEYISIYVRTASRVSHLEKSVRRGTSPSTALVGDTVLDVYNKRFTLDIGTIAHIEF